VKREPRISLSVVLPIAVVSLAVASCDDVEPQVVEPTVVAPGETLAVAADAAGKSVGRYDSPDSPGWSRTPEYRIDLQPAPPVHPSVALRLPAEPRGAPLFFRVARDDERLWLRLRWHDATRNDESAFERFPDSAAVQFALQDAGKTSYLMGTPEAPVNIWHWKASTDRAENLAAGGFGTLTRLPRQDVAAASEYTNGESREWAVVFSRALEAVGEYDATFGLETIVPIAFAIWQGADGQRDGDKLASTGWLEVRFGGLE
jgi:DMSO reductase family type II enzyme heme b subunit